MALLHFGKQAVICVRSWSSNRTWHCSSHRAADLRRTKSAASLFTNCVVMWSKAICISVRVTITFSYTHTHRVSKSWDRPLTKCHMTAFKIKLLHNHKGLEAESLFTMIQSEFGWLSVGFLCVCVYLSVSVFGLYALRHCSHLSSHCLDVHQLSVASQSKLKHDISKNNMNKHVSRRWFFLTK